MARLGMVARIALVLVCAVALEFMGNVALHRWQERELVPAERVERIAARLVEGERVALANHPRDRERLMHGMAGDGVALNWVPRTVITDFSPAFEQLAAMRARLVQAAPTLTKHELRLTVMPSTDAGARDLVGALRLADGSYISFRVGAFLGAPPNPAAVVLLHMLLIAAVLGVALLMIHRLVRPLRKLAEAADATGMRAVGIFEAEGPPEVQRVATAFAAMQTRLIKAMEDQTHALVAVSHDLRTPIQRLRLRASMIEDGEAQNAITADLGEMEHFIDATLDYVRSGEDEQPRLIDLAALVATIADSAADMGDDIVYHGPDECLVTARPLAIKRILGNLIDNARRHASHIELTLAGAGAYAGGDRIAIAVEDDGPGIPHDQRAEALLPFRRLDSARGRHAGGAGLGLATALKTARAMGGDMVLEDSRLGGLTARLILPRAIAANPATTAILPTVHHPPLT
ncbi:ATP-binding protein [Sphingopyxis sp. R3-92]|uniref:ATP-binding protein n=1 Tax=Sphingopyxis sp. R3-92 TaxID=3158553 RepID=UPI003EE5BD0F